MTSNTTRDFRTFFEAAVREVPDDPFLIWAETDRTWSYAEADEEINRAASAWLSLGVKSGDRVSFLLPNCPEFLFAWLGLAKIGGVLVAINTSFRHEEASYLITDSASRILLSCEEFRQLTDELESSINSIEVVSIDGPGGPRSWQDLLANQSAELSHPYPDEDSLISLIYTSGTTGRPKGVMQTHRNFVLTGEAYPTWMHMERGDRIYACLPLFHINSQAYSTMASIACRGAIILSRRFSASRFWPQVVRHHATVFNFIGAMTAILSKVEVTPEIRANKVRVAYGVPALKPATRRQLEEAFGLEIISGFGMSETTFGLVEPLDQPRRDSSMGVPRHHPDPGIPRTEAQIVDDEGNPVPDGVKGELLLKNDAMMVGYFADPERTAEAVKDGWLHTGDTAWRDSEGFFYYVDRKKDIIRRRGENVSSVEVEQVIERIPAVVEAAVVGVPSEMTDEELLAYVVRREGMNKVSPEEIVSWCETNLAYFKVPRYIEFVDSLPKTPTSKIQKAVLRGREPGSSRFDREERVVVK